MNEATENVLDWLEHDAEGELYYKQISEDLEQQLDYEVKRNKILSEENKILREQWNELQLFLSDSLYVQKDLNDYISKLNNKKHTNISK